MINFVLQFETAGHEVLHCIQAIAKQRDTSKMSWSAEHDASFAGQSLMFAAARVPALRDIFVDGCGSSFVWEVRCCTLHGPEHERAIGYAEQSALGAQVLRAVVCFTARRLFAVARQLRVGAARAQCVR